MLTPRSPPGLPSAGPPATPIPRPPPPTAIATSPPPYATAPATAPESCPTGHHKPVNQTVRRFAEALITGAAARHPGRSSRLGRVGAASVAQRQCPQAGERGGPGPEFLVEPPPPATGSPMCSSDVLYQQVSRGRRARLHQQVGQALETSTSTTATRSDRARPPLPACTADDRKTVAYATRAGKRAMALLAHEEDLNVEMSTLATPGTGSSGWARKVPTKKSSAPPQAVRSELAHLWIAEVDELLQSFGVRVTRSQRHDLRLRRQGVSLQR
jgi:hypothetical protein